MAASQHASKLTLQAYYALVSNQKTLYLNVVVPSFM